MLITCRAVEAVWGVLIHIPGISAIVSYFMMRLLRRSAPLTFKQGFGRGRMIAVCPSCR